MTEASMSARGLIERANRTPIKDAFEHFAGTRYELGESSLKAHCPWSWEHPNPLDRNFRVYPTTNTAYCFEIHGLLTPVRVVQIAEDCGPRDAAIKLLEHHGLLKPLSWQERFFVAERHDPPGGHPQVLVTALFTALSSHPNWADAQFSPAFTRTLEEALERLDTSSERAVIAWYAETKRELTATILRERSGVGTEARRLADGS